MMTGRCDYENNVDCITLGKCKCRGEMTATSLISPLCRPCYRCYDNIDINSDAECKMENLILWFKNRSTTETQNI